MGLLLESHWASPPHPCLWSKVGEGRRASSAIRPNRTHLLSNSAARREKAQSFANNFRDSTVNCIRSKSLCDLDNCVAPVTRVTLALAAPRYHSYRRLLHHLGGPCSLLCRRVDASADCDPRPYPMLGSKDKAFSVPLDNLSPPSTRNWWVRTSLSCTPAGTPPRPLGFLSPAQDLSLHLSENTDSPIWAALPQGGTLLQSPLVSMALPNGRALASQKVVPFPPARTQSSLFT